MESSKKLIMLNDDKEHPIFLIAKLKNRKHLFNICDEKLNPLSDVWFEGISMFDMHGLAIVKNTSHKQNIINKEGKLLLDKFYQSVYNLSYSENEECFFRIRNDDGLYNYVNQDGKILREEWLLYGDRFCANGYATIREANGRYNLMDENGNLLLNDNRFDDIFMTCRENIDLLKVSKDNKQNIVDKNLNIISKDMWFDSVNPYPQMKDIIFAVRLGRHCNLIDRNGKLISKIWFDNIFDPYKTTKYIVVYKNGKYNVMNIEGKLVFKGRWMDSKKIYSPIDISENIICIQSKNDGMYHALNLENIEKGIN